MASQPCLSEVSNDFPCADETWTYVANNGQCYKVLSGPKKLNWREGQMACGSALESVSNIPVVLPEMHNDSETNALVEFLVRVAVKEKIWLGAKREGRFESNFLCPCFLQKAQKCQ
ncbi:unnamed protein product [Schistocephalus solidus]|uniref:C-type lectin domain-containing protein n=1 Tax=Schistocephalus solidus TaxID=70667 RepID=A0A183SH04_SCHSO|nr:unnamed protein product [Schistocephalus solidus]